MEYVFVYVAVAFVIQAFAAWRTPYEHTRTIFIASAFWFLTVPLAIVSLVLDLVGWNFDVKCGNKMFGFRKSPNPRITGYALCLLTVEVQLFKTKP
jgi:hypothetical protein